MLWGMVNQVGGLCQLQGFLTNYRLILHKAAQSKVYVSDPTNFPGDQAFFFDMPHYICHNSAWNYKGEHS